MKMKEGNSFYNLIITQPIGIDEKQKKQKFFSEGKIFFELKFLK